MAERDEITEQIIAQTDIVEIISEHVELKKRGKNFLGLCPFHNEKTPSFNVSPELGIYKCFGCGKSGNVFSFLLEHNRMSFPEAKEFLASRLGINLQKDWKKSGKSQSLTQREQIINALQVATDYYSYVLNTTQGQTARKYLSKRQLNTETISKFNLGYAPDQWDATINTLKSKGFNEKTLLDAGLIIEKDKGGYYDRFRDRLVFPIRDSIGKIVGFGARRLNEDSNQPKYINSPQTLVYDKSRILYGLFDAKREIISRKKAILVEGYADVLMLHQKNIYNVVASSGTALTKEQLELLSRYCKSLYIIYDADNAGIKAAEKGIELALESGLAVNIVSLPEGEDPDSMVRDHGSELFIKYIDEAKSFIDFKIELFKSQDLLRTPESIAESIRELVRLISLIPDKMQHDFFISKVAGNLHLSESQVRLLYEEKNKIHKQRESLSSGVEKSGINKESSGDTAKIENKELTEETITNVGSSLDLIKQLLPEEYLLFHLIMTESESLTLIKDKFNLKPEKLISNSAKLLYSSIIENEFSDGIPLSSLLMNEDIPRIYREAFAAIAFRESISENWLKHGSKIAPIDINRNIEDAIAKLEIRIIEKKIAEYKDSLGKINDIELQKKLISELQRLGQKKLSLIDNLDLIQKRKKTK